MTDLDRLVEEARRDAWALLCMPEAPEESASRFFGGVP